MPMRGMVSITAMVCAGLLGGVAIAQADDPLTRPIAPDYAVRWTGAQEPVRAYGNTYLVGFEGLSVALIDTGAGLILLDAGVPQSARALEANIRRLGFRIEDIGYILTTEPHWDHAGAVAALARDSGARVVASAATAQVFRTGQVGGDDPQQAEHIPFPPVANVRAMADGETLRLGDVTVTARATPGHTAGSMSWTWRSCEGARCIDVVFASSLNAVSADRYRFSDPAHAGIVASFRRSFAKVRALPCDLMISTHPDQSTLAERRARFRPGAEPNALIDPAACRAFADRAEQRLDARLAEEVGSAR